ncbi:MAG: hypothetical protein KJI69_05785 [Patescibacteria group bacterium]|nr:hypothetical protein [Patescibacteria group bacterium]
MDKTFIVDAILKRATDNLINSVITLLVTNWIPDNTVSVTPAIKNVSDVKRIGGDNVLVYLIASTSEDNASGALAKKNVKTIAMDCRSFTSYAQALLIAEEVERILNANQIDPFGDQVYDISDVEDIDPISDRTRGLFRFKIQAKFQQFNKAI